MASFVITYFSLIKELRMKETKLNVVNETGLHPFVLERSIPDLRSSLRQKLSGLSGPSHNHHVESISSENSLILICYLVEVYGVE